MKMGKMALFLFVLVIFSTFSYAEPFSENISVNGSWNTVGFEILPTDNSRANVLSSLGTNIKQIKTIYNGVGYIWDESFPDSVNNLEYINFSLSYGIYMKADDIIEVTGYPDPSVPYMLNTTWSDWYEASECYVNNTIEVQRNKTEYDYNGLVANVTYYENQVDSCDFKIEVDVCDSGCNYTKVSDGIHDLKCYDIVERAYNFTNCTKRTEPIHFYVHNGNRYKFELINISNVEFIGESMEGVVLQGDGVYTNMVMINCSNITVINYTMNLGYYAMFIERTPNSHFENIVSRGAELRGILNMNGSDNNYFKNIEVSDVINYSCIRLHHKANNNIFEDIKVFNCSRRGIFLWENNTNNTFRNVESYDNFDGILVDNGSVNTVLDNITSYHNDDNGIYIIDSINTTLTNALTYENAWHGISIVEANYTTVINATTYNNSNSNKSGVYVELTDYFYGDNITSYDNKEGIIFINSSFGEVYNSNFSYNKEEGAYVNSVSRNVTFINNTFYLNDYGMFVSVSEGSLEDDGTYINNTWANINCDKDYINQYCQFDASNPGPITNFSARSGPNNKEIIISWVTPGDNYIDGVNYGSLQGDSQANYILKYSTNPINDSNWDAAISYLQGWVIGYIGEYEERTLIMPTDEVYYFAMQMEDDNLPRMSPRAFGASALSPDWNVSIWDAECRNARTLWGCNETWGISSPTTNYWYDTLIWDIEVDNSGNIEQEREIYARIWDNPEWRAQYQFNYTFLPFSRVNLSNITYKLDIVDEGYFHGAVSIKDTNNCDFYPPGVQCTRGLDPYGAWNFRSYSMAKHLRLNESPYTTVIPIEEGNNTANTYFDVDLIFCNNQTQLMYYHVPFNFTINTTYPWEANRTFCNSASGSEYTPGINPLQNNSGWYHMPTDTCDLTQYCYWQIKGLPPGIYNFSITTGYYDEDRPQGVSWIARFV